jgi:hypothetical protein
MHQSNNSINSQTHENSSCSLLLLAAPFIGYFIHCLYDFYSGNEVFSFPFLHVLIECLSPGLETYTVLEIILFWMIFLVFFSPFVIGGIFLVTIAYFLFYSIIGIIVEGCILLLFRFSGSKYIELIFINFWKDIQKMLQTVKDDIKRGGIL